MCSFVTPVSSYSYSGSDLAAILGGNAPAAARGREASMSASAEAPRRVVVALTHDSTLGISPSCSR